MAAGGLWPVYAVYALTGLSHGLYYSLLAVMEPLLPRPKPHLLFIVALSCLISPLCIHLARRASIWRTILLMGPLLVVGYTAWPLLHRESPALSLDSLHFAYTLLGVYSYATLFFAAARLNQNGEGGGIRLIGFGGATLLFSLLLGTYALPGIRSSLSQGTTVNYLFAFLAVTILISSFAFVFLLERLGFWASPRNDRESRPALLPPENALPSCTRWLAKIRRSRKMKTAWRPKRSAWSSVNEFSARWPDSSAGPDCGHVGPKTPGRGNLRQLEHLSEHPENAYQEYSAPTEHQQPPRTALAGLSSGGQRAKQGVRCCACRRF